MFLLSVGFCSSLLQMGKLGSNPLAGLAALGLGGLATPANTGGLNPAGTSKIPRCSITILCNTRDYLFIHNNRTSFIVSSICK